MLFAIWHHLYIFKNVKNTSEGGLLKVTLLHGCFSRYLKLYKWYQIAQSVSFIAQTHKFVFVRKVFVIDFAQNQVTERKILISYGILQKDCKRKSPQIKTTLPSAIQYD